MRGNRRECTTAARLQRVGGGVGRGGAADLGGAAGGGDDEGDEDGHVRDDGEQHVHGPAEALPLVTEKPAAEAAG